MELKGVMMGTSTMEMDEARPALLNLTGIVLELLVSDIIVVTV